MTGASEKIFEWPLHFKNASYGPDMYSHILVGVGQSVLYQCTPCVCVCAHVNMFVQMCIYVM